MLSPNNFAAFFMEVYGYEPFPWQKRLLQQINEQGKWPSVLDLPTGSGKTAAIDIAVFHSALQADRGETRLAPVRIAFVVDRRLVVDDAFVRAKRLADVLAYPQGRPITARVAERLKELSGDSLPLLARRLRGGIPREDDWARTPSQPTVLCSTVDQVGSRLLFRGYGISDSMKPVHAGLIGSDCLILLDEAHLAEPFRQTLEWVGIYRDRNWRETDNVAPWGVALLTATPGERPQDCFSLDDEDRSHPILKKRLSASKVARLVVPSGPKTKPEDAGSADENEMDDRAKEVAHRAASIVREVHRAIEHFKAPENGASVPAIGVVVNRVARARAVFEQLKKDFREDLEKGAILEPILMIGAARPLDRDELTKALEPIRTRTWTEREARALEKPLMLVSTQCIEVGVDIDLDALVTEAAPLDALRQRFGRLNRGGREVKPYAAVVAAKSDLSGRTDDPVYGKAIRASWGRLLDVARKRGDEQIVDFGMSGFAVRMEGDALSPKEDAPVLLPAHLDLLSYTAPLPVADPEIALCLHGPNRQPDSISVIWRADIDPDKHSGEEGNENIRRLLLLVPPRPAEAVELPLWAVRRWLEVGGSTPDSLADAATGAPEEDGRARRDGERRRIFRWKGDDVRSRWISPSDLRPGVAIVVPARYGGVDRFGWNPKSKEIAQDVGREAAQPFAGHRFAVRIAPGLVGESVSDGALADALGGAVSQRWRDLRVALLALRLPQEVRDDLIALDDANRKSSVAAYLDLYGADSDRPRGVVFVAPFGIRGKSDEEDGRPNATEDDASGSILGLPLSLQQHSKDVEDKAECFARSAGLPAARIADLKLAGFLHDAGKADPRFQAWLHYGDPLGPDPENPDTVLAKSGRPLPRSARAASGLTEHWRHEAFSVRIASCAARFSEANDPDLVLWLIGSHHGYGRPLFPHHDPEDGKPRKLPSVPGLPSELPSGPGPQSLAFDWRGLDWPSLFARLKARYGIWELARMEAILRLADHRASEERAAKQRTAKEDEE